MHRRLREFRRPSRRHDERCAQLVEGRRKPGSTSREPAFDMISSTDSPRPKGRMLSSASSVHCRQVYNNGGQRTALSKCQVCTGRHQGCTKPRVVGDGTVTGRTKGCRKRDGVSARTNASDTTGRKGRIERGGEGGGGRVSTPAFKCADPYLYHRGLGPSRSPPFVPWSVHRQFVGAQPSSVVWIPLLCRSYEKIGGMLRAR